MLSSKLDGGNAEVQPPGPQPATETTDTTPTSAENTDNVLATVAVVGAVGVGVALVEAALLPGVVLGAAAVLAPKYLPQLGSTLDPLFKSTVRNVYKLGRKTNEVFAEAKEKVHDVMAEVNAEDKAKPTAPNAGGNSQPIPTDA